MSDQFVALLPIAAGVFAIPQFLPQLLRVVRNNQVDGVSWTWAVMTSVNNAAWAVYFVWSAYWTSLISVLVVVLTAGLLAAALSRRGRTGNLRSVLTVLGWVAALAVATVVFGLAGLGAMLAFSVFLQAAPSVWTAYRSADVAGISVSTWLLVLGELACFGLFGLFQNDPRLIALGVVGSGASLLMLARVVWAGRSGMRNPVRRGFRMRTGAASSLALP